MSDQFTFMNPNETVEFTHDEWPDTWQSNYADASLRGEPGKSVMTFKRWPSQGDEDRATDLAVKTNVHYSNRAARRAAARNQEYDPKIETERLLSAVVAKILVSCVSWDGPFIVYPDWHPQSGQKAELNAENIRRLPPHHIAAIEVYLDKLYAGRSEEEEAEFPDGDSSVGRSNPGSGASGDQLPQDSVRLLRVGGDGLGGAPDPEEPSTVASGSLHSAG